MICERERARQPVLAPDDQVFATHESQKRITTGGASAQQSLRRFPISSREETHEHKGEPCL